ncbi:MAG: SDR family NAD(P)-dependent oxidoreductase [Ignavibacteriales bacterium]
MITNKDYTNLDPRLMDFSGKVAVVTGSGSGIGKATVSILAKLGAAVVVCDLNRSGAEAVAGEIRGTGGEAIAIGVDVSSTESVNAMFEQVVCRYGWVDVLINNAGIAEVVDIENITDQQWDRMIGIHLGGTFKCCRAATPIMKKRKQGAIVNISSTYGMVGWEKWCHYSAAKAGVLGFTKALAKELAPFDIRVNAIAPGSVITPIQGNVTRAEMQDWARTAIPLGRAAEPEDIARAIVFLASDEASFITGQLLSVNGGAVIVGI